MIQRSFIDNAVASEEIFVSKMQTILNFALDYRDSKLTSRYGTIILKAKDYIEKNYFPVDGFCYSADGFRSGGNALHKQDRGNCNRRGNTYKRTTVFR